MAIGFVVGAVVSGGLKVYRNHKSGKEWYDGLAISVLAGGVGGAISCITIPGVSNWVCAAIFGGVGNLTAQVILGEIDSLEDIVSSITVGAIAGLIGEASSQVLIKGVTKYFNSLTKSAQKKFLSGIGQITNRQLTEIRRIVANGLTPKILSDLVEKYGYNVLVSAFVSSTPTSVAN